MPFPAHLVPPPELGADDFVLRPITAGDAALDHAAVVETRELLRSWEQSDWPADDFTVDENRDDLARMERRHIDGEAFCYTMLDPTRTTCLGCVYVFPTDARFLAASRVTAVGDARWDDVDAAVYFWVRASRLADGLDRRLFAELRRWFATDWRVDGVVYVTSEPFEQQVELLRATDLDLRFEIEEPDKPGRYLAFAEPGDAISG